MKRTIEKAGKIGYLLKETFNAFLDDNVMKLSAALSYYTIFSLALMLILIISITSILYGQGAVEGILFHCFNNFTE